MLYKINWNIDSDYNLNFLKFIEIRFWKRKLMEIKREF